jgi:hypothetical protein
MFIIVRVGHRHNSFLCDGNLRVACTLFRGRWFGRHSLEGSVETNPLIDSERQTVRA